MAGLGFRLLMITDRRQAPRPLPEQVEACLAAGLRAVQLREKDLSVRELLALAEDLRARSRRAGARLIVNDRADVALAVGADGVQRTHASLPVSALRSLGPSPAFLVGASVHALEEARRAERDGADFLVFGPVHDTPSKRAFGPPQGLAALEAVARAVGVPVLAVGGIDPARARDCLRAGAAGVAVISALVAAPDPGDRVRAFVEALGGA
jgi:thiamine-phosphate pyrophosphorylase